MLTSIGRERSTDELGRRVQPVNCANLHQENAESLKLVTEEHADSVELCLSAYGP